MKNDFYSHYFSIIESLMPLSPIYFPLMDISFIILFFPLVHKSQN